MKVFNENICVESFKDRIEINNKKIRGGLLSIVEKIKKITNGILSLNIDGIQDKFSEFDIIILLAISYNVQSLHNLQDNDDYEITFSYHFPLYFETNFIKILLKNFDIIKNGNVVNLATKGEFVRANVSNEKEYEAFYEKHGYWLRHNDKIVNIDNNNLKLNDTLNNWNLYCKSKFGKEFSKYSLDTYNHIYSLPGFHVIEYMINYKVIAQGVVFISKQTNTLYFCIFWWNDYYKSLSPGKYNYEKVIEYCHQNNLAFSFCYGFQKYKFELIKFFKNSNHQKWIELC